MSDTVSPEDDGPLYNQGWTDGINGREKAHPDDEDYMRGYDAGEAFIEEEDEDEGDL